MEISKYFEKRERTYPQDVKGKLRKIKNISSVIFLAIFFLSPFIRWSRGLDLPNQAILIDIVNSRGYFFFIKIWPEEVFYIAGLLIFTATILFFVTSLFGRIWCGYSCPQTVWTDMFIKIERFFQGDRNQRIILDRKKSINKYARKAATHLTWIALSLITGFGFVLYFNDAYKTTHQLLSMDLSQSITLWALAVAAMTYIMAGFAREQVCNYMCPYARFQSVMFDKDTLIISYDEKRGEPRAKHKMGESLDNRGHCIDCKQCVVVCPANIDIRDGLQMECIACGLCVDACNNVMEKLDLPPGLIRYDTHSHLKSPDNPSTKFKILKPRTFYYSFIIAIIGLVVTYGLFTRPNLDLKIIPIRNPIFVMMSNGDIRNGYNVKLYNKSNRDHHYSIKADGIDDLILRVQNPPHLDINNIYVKNDSIKTIKVYLKANRKSLEGLGGKNNIKFHLEEKKTKEQITQSSVFISTK